MQVSVEAPSKLERRVTVVVPVETLNVAFNKRIDEITKKVKIDGFRPGKAPRNVITQRYGETARQEALGRVIEDSLYQAISQEKLNPVSTPSVEPKVIDPDKPLEFVATFEVFPEIEALNFTAATMDKDMAVISDEDVTKVVDHLRSQHTKWQKVERPAKEKDQVVIDFRGSIDGVAFAGGEAHDYPIVLGNKTMIPGFEEGIMNMKPGEEKVVKITFPGEYFSKDVAGKEADFAIKVISVSEPELPALDEELVKKFGVKSGKVEDLQAEIRKNLERELARVIKLKLKNKVFDKLLEQNPLEIPKAMIEREGQRIHDEVHPHHGHEHHHSEEEMAQFNEAGKRNVALGLLVAEVVKQHKLSVDHARVDALINTMASAYENPAEVTTWYANNKQAKAEVEMQVLEEQVVEKLLENVKVNEKMMSYSELMERN